MMACWLEAADFCAVVDVDHFHFYFDAFDAIVMRVYSFYQMKISEDRSNGTENKTKTFTLKCSISWLWTTKILYNIQQIEAFTEFRWYFVYDLEFPHLKQNQKSFLFHLLIELKNLCESKDRKRGFMNAVQCILTSQHHMFLFSVVNVWHFEIWRFALMTFSNSWFSDKLNFTFRSQELLQIIRPDSLMLCYTIWPCLLLIVSSFADETIHERNHSLSKGLRSQ